MDVIVGAETPIGRQVAEQVGRLRPVREVASRPMESAIALAHALADARAVHVCLELASGRKRGVPSELEVVLAACRLARVRRLVHVSSAEVYGRSSRCHDEWDWPRPAGQRARRLLAVENRFRRELELEVVTVRPATVLTAHPPAPSARVLGGIRSGAVWLPRRGRARRAFISGDDLGRAVAAAAERGRPGAVYLAAGFESCWAEVIRAQARALGLRVRLLPVPVAAATLWSIPDRERRELVDLMATPLRLDATRTRRELVWSPRDAGPAEVAMRLAPRLRTNVQERPAGLSTARPRIA
jgi:nucleoside-diphosphate-sugar epimerase